MSEKVAVLMSTYNGEKYIMEQIDSILGQKDVDITLYIRDDGSKDKTIQIIENYTEHHNNIKVTLGKNIGVGNSFMSLVYNVPDSYDYYAFSDQDDIWLSTKLKMAIDMIKNSERKPLLYCSNQMLVDGNLNNIGMRYTEVPDITYRQIICQNKVSGCTMVWNKELQLMLSDNAHRPSKELLDRRIHDVWVAFIASVIGEIMYDQNAYILYRQHNNNVVGVRKTNIVNQWIKKIKNPTQRNGRSMICRETYEKFEDIIVDKNTLEWLQVYGFYKDEVQKKIQLFNDTELISHTNESRIMYRIKVLFNLI